MKLKIYFWQGINHLQEREKGTLVAENLEQAHQILLQRGLQKIKLQRNWQLTQTATKGEVCALLNQLAILLNASVPLKTSLQILLQDCSNIGLNDWLRQIINDLNTGLSFSQALDKQGKYFNHQERQLVLVGEMTGQLAKLCAQIATNKERQLALQRKIQKILLYPMVVLSISIILTGLLLIFIVPQFSQMYGDNQESLPFFTYILLQLSYFLRYYLLQMILLIVFLGIFLHLQYKKSLKFKKCIAELIRKMPIIGKINQLGRLINFSHSLGLMLQAGIPLNQALSTFLVPTSSSSRSSQKTKNISNDFLLQKYVKHMLVGLERGYPLSTNLSSQLFPEQAKQMIQIGERSGKLAMMFNYIATANQQKLDHQIDLLSQLLEPLLMLIIGSLIGLVMLGMYLPIFNMGALIQ